MMSYPRPQRLYSFPHLLTMKKSKRKKLRRKMIPQPTTMPHQFRISQDLVAILVICRFHKDKHHIMRPVKKPKKDKLETLKSVTTLLREFIIDYIIFLLLTIQFLYGL